MNEKNLTHKEQVKTCIIYLDAFATRSNGWSEQDSYQLKHIIEKYYDCYITNDAVIEAAAVLKFRAKQTTTHRYIFGFKLPKKLPSYR